METICVRDSMTTGHSEEIIPAVLGEFYSYSARCDNTRPLYVLLKCKANKSRSFSEIHRLRNESNLIFLLEDTPRACSIQSAVRMGTVTLPADLIFFDESYIALTPIKPPAFRTLRQEKDIVSLVNECEQFCSKKQSITEISLNSVYAIKPLWENMVCSAFLRLVKPS